MSRPRTVRTFDARTAAVGEERVVAGKWVATLEAKARQVVQGGAAWWMYTTLAAKLAAKLDADILYAEQGLEDMLAQLSGTYVVQC